MKRLSPIIKFSFLTVLSGALAIGWLSLRFEVDTNADVFYHCEPHPTDALEYHLPAANLALHGVFPFYGLMGPIDDYRLCGRADTVRYFQILQHAPIIVFPSKPPLYSFLLGCSYKVFGLRPFSGVLLNTMCWGLMVILMLAAGKMMLGEHGWVAGALGLIVLVSLEQKGLAMLDAELLTRTLALAAAVIAAKAIKTGSILWFSATGAMLMLLSLTKGYFLLPMVVMLCWLMLTAVRTRSRRDFSSAGGFAIGGLLFVLPWVIHINNLMRIGVADRMEFSDVLQAGSPHIRLQHHDDVFDSHGSFRQDVVLELMLFHQYQHARENGPIFVSNQMGDYNILNVHNEYCTDGDFHPEWRIIQSSFYNSHQEMGKYSRICRFYEDDPALGMRITAAKLKAAITKTAWAFIGALLISALLVIQRRFPQEFVPGLMLLLTSPIVVILIYGDPRFIQSTDAVAVLLLTLGTALAIKYRLEKRESTLNG